MISFISNISPSNKRPRTKANASSIRPCKRSNLQWTDEEDELIAQGVKSMGDRAWTLISRTLNDRTGKQCRDRWKNVLNPGVKKGNWTEDEDRILFETQKKVGNFWAAIAKRLPGRTDLQVKNRFYTTMRKEAKGCSPKNIAIKETQAVVKDIARIAATTAVLRATLNCDEKSIPQEKLVQAAVEAALLAVSNLSKSSTNSKVQSLELRLSQMESRMTTMNTLQQLAPLYRFPSIEITVPSFALESGSLSPRAKTY